jgi:hypothetical protein
VAPEDILMFLCVWKEESKMKVSLLSRAGYISEFSTEVSTSPIFPVDSSFSPPEDLNPTCYILFSFPQKPFSVIGKLCAKLNDERKIRSLWFSHGLASLLVISKEKALVDAVNEVIADQIVASEIWEVVDGELLSTELNRPISGHKNASFPDGKDLPPDVQALVNEYVACMNVALNRAAAYRPEHLRILEDLHEEVRLTIETLSFFLIPGTPKPARLRITNTDLDFLLSDPASKMGYAQSLIDQILQINSSLSYVITQAYTGVVPILQNRCPISSLSLLGTGTSAGALLKIYESVSKVFGKYPIPRTIRDIYEDDLTNIPIFKNFSTYNVEEWRTFSGYLDTKFRNMTVDHNDQMFHLSYFSGQYGFREMMFGISAAIQSLTVGATPRWTLMTLTHEYLHAHVRAIMGALFPEQASYNFSHLYDIFSRPGPLDAPTARITVRKRLGLIILSILRTISETRILAEKILKGQSAEQVSTKLTQEEMLHKFLERSKDIQEFLAHTLDYVYFYGSNAELYISLIWLTWSTIPVVQERISHYVLRTLVSISIDFTGDPQQRFSEACDKLFDVFKTLKSYEVIGNSTIIDEAIQLLTSKPHNSALKAEFLGYFRLGDMARYLMHSNSVHHDIMSDTLQTTIGGVDGRYAIETGEFQDTDISSPIAFILDRAARKLKEKQPIDYDRIVYETCWEFLVLASTSLE